MDTSAEYIKMCERAKEIQKAKVWKIGWGDYVLHEGVVKIVAFEQPLRKMRRSITWLPRQDQLQEMLSGLENLYAPEWSSTPSIYLAHRFKSFCEPETGEGNTNIYLRKGSMEVLWLAFVMEMKYDKTWDGILGEWVE